MTANSITMDSRLRGNDTASTDLVLRRTRVRPDEVTTLVRSNQIRLSRYVCYANYSTTFTFFVQTLGNFHVCYANTRQILWSSNWTTFYENT